MEENKHKIEELDEQIRELSEKLFTLKNERDKAYAEGLYDLVGKYFTSAHYEFFEIIKVKDICNFDGIYTIKAACLKYYTSKYKADEYFIYEGSLDIPLSSDKEDSFDEFDKNYIEISEEEFNSLLKEAFNKWSNKISGETV